MKSVINRKMALGTKYIHRSRRSAFCLFCISVVDVMLKKVSSAHELVGHHLCRLLASGGTTSKPPALPLLRKVNSSFKRTAINCARSSAPGEHRLSSKPPLSSNVISCFPLALCFVVLNWNPEIRRSSRQKPPAEPRKNASPTV